MIIAKGVTQEHLAFNNIWLPVFVILLKTLRDCAGFALYPCSE